MQSTLGYLGVYTTCEKYDLFTKKPCFFIIQSLLQKCKGIGELHSKMCGLKLYTDRMSPPSGTTEIKCSGGILFLYQQDGFIYSQKHNCLQLENKPVIS